MLTALSIRDVVLIEALIIALAGRGAEAAFDSLDRLGNLRSSIDSAWSKRGTRKKKESRRKST